MGGAVLLVLRPGLRQKKGRFPAHLYHLEFSRHLVAASGEAYEWAFNPLIGIIISFFVGYASSFLGIGGGIIHVPVLIYFPASRSTWLRPPRISSWPSWR